MHQGQSNYPKFLPRFAIIKSVFSCFPMFMIFRPEDPEAWRSFGCTKVREVVSRVDEKVQGGEKAFLPQAPPFAVENSRQGSGDSPRPRAEANDPIRLNLAGFEGRQ